MMLNTQIESQSQAVRRANLPQVAVEPMARKNLLRRRAGTAIQVDLPHAVHEEVQLSMLMESNTTADSQPTEKPATPRFTTEVDRRHDTIRIGFESNNFGKDQHAPWTVTLRLKENKKKPGMAFLKGMETHNPNEHAIVHENNEIIIWQIEKWNEATKQWKVLGSHDADLATNQERNKLRFTWSFAPGIAQKYKLGSMTGDELKKFEAECIDVLCSRDTDKFDSLDYGDEQNHEDDDDDSFEQAAAFVHRHDEYADDVIEQHFRKKYEAAGDSKAKARIAKTFYETCLMMAKPGDVDPSLSHIK